MRLKALNPTAIEIPGEVGASTDSPTHGTSSPTPTRPSLPADTCPATAGGLVAVAQERSPACHPTAPATSRRELHLVGSGVEGIPASRDQKPTGRFDDQDVHRVMVRAIETGRTSDELNVEVSEDPAFGVIGVYQDAYL